MEKLPPRCPEDFTPEEVTQFRRTTRWVAAGHGTPFVPDYGRRDDEQYLRGFMSTRERIECAHGTQEMRADFSGNVSGDRFRRDELPLSGEDVPQVDRSNSQN